MQSCGWFDPFRVAFAMRFDRGLTPTAIQVDPLRGQRRARPAAALAIGGAAGLAPREQLELLKLAEKRRGDHDGHHGPSESPIVWEFP
jgi:hypothetical protein